MIIFIVCFGLVLLGLTALWLLMLVKMEELQQQVNDLQFEFVLNREFDDEEEEK